MINGHTIIKAAGKDWPVTLPDFADREDIVLAWHAALAASDGAALRRVACAALGLSTGIGRQSGAAWTGTGILLYGGAVYSWLRGQKMTIAEVVAAGTEVVNMLSADLFAREAEVEANADFTAAGEVSSIS
jgi:hypothetical protein